MKCDFEPKIQVECVLEIVNIVRAGDLLSKRGEVLQHAGCVIGSLGAYIEGDSEPEVFGANGDEPLPATVEDCCDALEPLCTGEGAQMGPLVTILIRQLVKLLIDQLL